MRVKKELLQRKPLLVLERAFECFSEWERRDRYPH